MSEVKKYQKNPVVVEALLLLDSNAVYAADPTGAAWEKHVSNLYEFLGEEGWSGDHTGVTIETLEGSMHAGPGDYIIKGVKGEFYPCKPDIFALTYTQVVGAPVGAAAVDEKLASSAAAGAVIETQQRYSRSVDLLRKAAEQFRAYEASHRAKNTPESIAKAEVNAALALEIEAELANVG